LGFSRPALQRRLSAWAGPTAAADTAGGRADDPQAHAQPVGRGAVRALAGEPVLPVLLRRRGVLPPAAVRPHVADALAAAARRGAARRPAAAKPMRGHQD